MALGLLLAGCGGEEANPLGEDTFSGMNVDKIRYDCNQTVQCKNQNGEMLGENPFDRCVEDTAVVLEGNAAKQMEFLINFNRCSAFVVCEYRACAIADTAGGFGMMQMDKIMYSCQQEVECRRQLGTLVGDPTSELNSCVANNIGYLDTFNPTQRMAYESEFARCNGQLACPFSDCFPFPN